MRWADRLLQQWRARKARPWIPAGARLLDIGCHQGEFLDSLAGRIGPSVGIDPLAVPRETPSYRVIGEAFAGRLPFADATFDAVTALAVIEHLPARQAFIGECRRILCRNGRVVLTVPAPIVDHLVQWLIRFGFADGMSLEEHTGFDPGSLPSDFGCRGFSLERWDRFQLGCNHLMVFRLMG